MPQNLHEDFEDGDVELYSDEFLVDIIAEEDGFDFENTYQNDCSLCE